WITPKIFDDLGDPAPGVAALLRPPRRLARRPAVTIVFCAGNGDHVLNYAGRDAWDHRFDWARYNCFAAAPGGPAAAARAHNRDWLARVRDGGERSFNPYSAGPMFVLSEQPMDYRTLAGVYAAVRAEAERRGLRVSLLEYLEPGPEFCRSEWKTERHPEVAAGTADAGGHLVPGVIDVTAPLAADTRPYAAYPGGIEGGLPAGDFVAAQTAGVHGRLRAGRDPARQPVRPGRVLASGQRAPPLTPERSAGIERFFLRLREAMGDRLVYWMDTYWRAEVERAAWGMTDAAYRSLDAILVSTFAVLVERTEIVPNLLSKAALGGPRPRCSGSTSWIRGTGTGTYLDDRRTYLYQREVLAAHARVRGRGVLLRETTPSASSYRRPSWRSPPKRSGRADVQEGRPSCGGENWP
ncbi:hypothetical protein, partial [Nonomuraea rubra]|uniref:hypothetical protein n=1 Tax=Nonomuraea rubra TaxID=46180 RepID=UPI0031E89DF6